MNVKVPSRNYPKVKFCSRIYSERLNWSLELFDEKRRDTGDLSGVPGFREQMGNYSIGFGEDS